MNFHKFFYSTLCLILILPLTSTAKPVVAVTIPPQRWLTRELASNAVEVLLILPPDQNPHSFEPPPSMLAKLSKADLWLTVGLPFEVILENRVRDISPNIKICSTKINHHDNGHDPHSWLSPSTMAAMATNYASEIGTLNGVFATNLSLHSTMAKINSATDEAGRLLSNLPQKVFWVQHASWGQFADYFGITQKAIETNSGEPGARHLAQLAREALKDNVKVLFANKQHSVRNLEILAKQIGAKVDTLDPLAENWPENIVKTAQKISGSLKKPQRATLGQSASE